MSIKLVGIEFEGGWRGTIGEAPFSGHSIKYDGSVDPVYDVQHYGELCSDPMTPENALSWAHHHVPHAVNKSCGTHVHFSFDSLLEYSVCVTRKYMNGMYEVLGLLARKHRDTHPAFSSQTIHRLSGSNSYCKKSFNPIMQMGDDCRDSTRYSGVNYCHKLHGTIEIRVLPGIADAGLCHEVLEEMFTFTNKFIKDNAFKKRIRFRR